MSATWWVLSVVIPYASLGVAVGGSLGWVVASSLSAFIEGRTLRGLAVFPMLAAWALVTALIVDWLFL